LVFGNEELPGLLSNIEYMCSAMGTPKQSNLLPVLRTYIRDKAVGYDVMRFAPDLGVVFDKIVGNPQSFLQLSRSISCKGLFEKILFTFLPFG